MVVDSFAFAGDVINGSAVKYRSIPDRLGGGFVAATGITTQCTEAMKAFSATGEKPKTGSEVEMLWLKADGDVQLISDGGSYTQIDKFHAIGCGFEIAFGAMEFGATAYEACEIACRRHSGCGGEIHRLTVSGVGT